MEKSIWSKRSVHTHHPEECVYAHVVINVRSCRYAYLYMLGSHLKIGFLFYLRRDKSFESCTAHGFSNDFQ